MNSTSSPAKKPQSSNDLRNDRTSAENDHMRFRGKVAVWWYAIVIAMIVGTVHMTVLGVLGIVNSEPEAILTILGAVIFLLFDVFLIDSCTRNYVDLNKGSLTVRVSALTETIPYSSIDLVKETNSVWASLSTSLDRILIRHRRYNDILIAVVDKDGFFTEIHTRSPQATIERKACK